ncbi:NAD(P)-binding protein [Rhodococcus sp. Q]|uniref:NAD(P)-binding protein n=1 Tax=Rhodococcus sp. Q TaxID=2502252 RepID=UPI0010F7D8E8|nr:NAD(P)-binding protein [Rhodococcus sp. Q]
MATHTLDTDYLVIGAGAAGMAFTDAVAADSSADVIVVDRRHAPGGHWNDAYPFVRLHQPSSYYGVNSLPLGGGTIDADGLNAGMYERATGAEICGYFDRVMHSHLLPSGAVRYHPMCEYDGDNAFVSLVTGDRYDVTVRRAVVDARYLSPSVPATSPPPFVIEAGVRCIPVGELSAVSEPPPRYVIVGAGKTAMDACVWLLGVGVEPERIRWVKPRESWLLNRYFVQGDDLVGNLVEGGARQMQAAANAASLADLFRRLEESRILLRVDERATPTMFKMPTSSTAEIDELRRIEDVVRLGHVQRVESRSIVLDEGAVSADADDLYVHCAASGLNPAPAVPIFAPNRITLQPIRSGLIPFNAAFVGYVEASGRGADEKNRLCPANRMPDVPLDWVRGRLTEMAAERSWSKEPDIAEWLERSRLNHQRGVGEHRDEPAVRDAVGRFVECVRPGVARLMALFSEAQATG